MNIRFNFPYTVGKELQYVSQAIAAGRLAGYGPFTRRCQSWLEQSTGCEKAFLTHSCTAALEMAAVLADFGPGDEVIMPSYTFVSTANAFVLRGGIPVFVDIREDTLNMDERLIEAAITPRTKAIVPVHYAGVSCEMDVIMEIARRHDLIVIEDAAQGIMSSYKGQPLGSIGHLGCISFHETKNVISGEGGALLVNDSAFAERAEIIHEKGTDRRRFFRGQVDKYTWVDIGSSYLPGEIIAAFLFAQLEEAARITEHRLSLWDRYHAAFESIAKTGNIRRPAVPPHCQHNAHMYYVLLQDLQHRTIAMETLENKGISAVFHYVPLHSSPAGLRYARTRGHLPVTESTADRLLRLPMWYGLEEVQDIVINAVNTL